MKIVITGANGFVGAALCRYFHQAGHTIIGIGRQPKPPVNLLRFATYIPADITRELPMLEADVCIHAAALASDTATYAELYASNVTGTQQVLQAAVHCQYFIQISSSSVYAFHDRLMREDETDTKSKLSPYGATKLLAEKVLETQIPTGQHRLILRPRAIYGIGDRILLPRILQMLKKNKLYLPVPPQVQTSLTHVNNIGYAISLFLQQSNPPALQIFNVSDDMVYNLREIIVKTISEIYPQPFKTTTVPVGGLKFLVGLNKYVPINPQLNPMVLGMLTQSAVLDITQIKKGLNYAPQFTFNAAIPDISQWVNKLGGIAGYLQNKEAAPWLVSE